MTFAVPLKARRLIKPLSVVIIWNLKVNCVVPYNTHYPHSPSLTESKCAIAWVRHEDCYLQGGLTCQPIHMSVCTVFLFFFFFLMTLHQADGIARLDKTLA